MSGETKRGAEIHLSVNHTVSGLDLNSLFAAAWPGHESRDFTPILARSLVYICAYKASFLVGFVNVAWDGGEHAFLLDPTVHPDIRRTGIGTRLLASAITEARKHGLRWLHVDYEPHLEQFYSRCGFRSTSAGLLEL